MVTKKKGIIKNMENNNNHLELKRTEHLHKLFRYCFVYQDKLKKLENFLSENPDFEMNRPIGVDRGFLNQPLDYAFRHGTFEQVKLLMSKGATSSCKYFGRPLCQLIRNSQETNPMGEGIIQKMKILLKSGESPLKYKQGSETSPMVDIFENWVLSPKTFELGVQMIQLLIEFGWTQDKMDKKAQRYLNRKLKEHANGDEKAQRIIFMIETTSLQKILHDNIPNNTQSSLKTPKNRI